jgi:hypothetical protein
VVFIDALALGAGNMLKNRLRGMHRDPVLTTA